MKVERIDNYQIKVTSRSVSWVYGCEKGQGLVNLVDGIYEYAELDALVSFLKAEINGK